MIIINRNCLNSGKNIICNRQKTNSELLKQSIDELEQFTKKELPNITKSTQNAIDILEQNAINLKALMNIK